MLGFEVLYPILNHEEYVAKRRYWRKRNAYYYGDILRLLKYVIPSGSSILEFGHDEGWFINELKPARGVFVGASRPAVAEGKQNYPHIEFHEDSGDNSLNLQGESFEYILMINTTGGVPHLLPYFKRALRFAKPETRLVVTYYNYLWQPILRLAEKLGLKQPQPIQNWVSLHDLDNLLELAGFEVVKQARRMILPKRIPGISWFFNRIVARLPLFDKLGFWNYIIARPAAYHFAKREYSVSIVVPVRNEKGNIRSIVERIPEMGSGTEIIFVEGGSNDGTWEEIQQVANEWKDRRKIVVTKQEGMGKGDAVRKGFKLSNGEILMILDADCTS